MASFSPSSWTRMTKSRLPNWDACVEGLSSGVSDDPRCRGRLAGDLSGPGAKGADDQAVRTPDQLALRRCPAFGQGDPADEYATPPGRSLASRPVRNGQGTGRRARRA